MSDAAALYPPRVTAKTAASGSIERVGFRRKGLWLMLLGAAGIPLSLVWDYSWECTIGVDLFWGPPHSATYLAVFFAGLGAVSMIRKNGEGVRLGPLSGPAGAWIGIWGALAFAAAV